MFLTYDEENKLCPGKLAIAYASPLNQQPILVSDDPDTRWDSRWGQVTHSVIQYHPYGHPKILIQSRSSSSAKQTRRVAKQRRSEIYLLHPTPSLWTRSLPHRTQILYAPDISFILTQLNVQRGDWVVESGTGSGSFMHACCSVVGLPSSSITTESDMFDGRVFTFEYHPKRAELVRQEISEHGLSSTAKLTCTNVYETGFVPCSSHNMSISQRIDAVFLDLPSPWLAIRHVPSLFRPDKVGRICCFSPCIEQVQRTRDELVKFGFTDIKMFECLERHWEVKQFDKPLSVESLIQKNDNEKPEKSNNVKVDGKEMRGHTSYLTFASYLPSVARSEIN